MNYSKLQKFFSSLIIFSLLFSISIRIPVLDFLIYADDSKYYDLVSIIVEEEIYDDIKSEVKRYAEDVQWFLENTKVVILPTPKDTPAFNVASLLELLYNEWYKGLSNVSFESRLVWTVLVGDIKLPEVYLKSNSSKTIVPYTDFEDKKYIFNHENQKYEENLENLDWIKSEIWHWVISPNLWTSLENLTGIKNYFDKNHDFYIWNWNFKSEDLIMNQDKSGTISNNYIPSVFYYDSFRENSSLNYNKYFWYKSYLDNKEDIVYNRFNKKLAWKIKDEVMWDQNVTVQELLKKVDPSFDISSYSDSLDISTTPDIQTRSIVENVSKQLIEMFSAWTIWDFRKDVHNAWRYNMEGKSINMDMVPYIITVLDLVNDKVLKQWSSDLEEKIDEIVATSLQNNIFVPYRVNDLSVYSKKYLWTCEDPTTGTYSCDKFKLYNYYDTYENILYWNQAFNINKAEECSIFRWSTYNFWTLVEANRWYDYSLIQWDIATLQGESISCISWVQNWTSLEWYWGSNTPLNTDYNQIPPLLKTRDITNSIVPIFDIAWSLEVKDKSLSYPYSPISKNSYSYLDCLEDNFLLSVDREPDDNDWTVDIETVYQIPINSQSRINWSCNSNSTKSSFNKIRPYVDLKNETRIIYSSDDPPIQTIVPKCTWLTCIDWNLEIFFKEIPSYITHKSPTFEELDIQIKNMLTPSLPIDKDRYIDFKSSSWYQKINYPYLFRLNTENNDTLSYENIEKALKNYLDKYNSVLGTSLFNFLKIHSDVVWWEIWKSNYLDTLIFSIYWNKLNISWKYKFVFENYLSDQFWWNNFEFGLPINKPQYEISYLWAPWDSSSMYIMLDPEAKKDNPYADIYSRNATLNSSLLWSNISTKDEEKNPIFNCAPPEWVIIWKWLPAVSCWLKDMLPPTISFSPGECSWWIWLSDEDLKDLFENWGDLNKNWVIDCIELKLSGSTIELGSDASKYKLNKLWKLKSLIKDSDWKTITLDSSTEINFQLTKISVPNDNTLPFSKSNSKEVYNIDTSTWGYLDYIDFVEWKVRAQYWVWEKSFYLKNKIADISFKTFYEAKDYNQNILAQNESDQITIKVRDDSLFVDSYKLNARNPEIILDYWEDVSYVSGYDNIFITSSDHIESIKNNLWVLDSFSQSKEKIFLSISNYENNWVKKAIDYPLKVEVIDENDNIVSQEKIINNIDSEIISLWNFQKSWMYKVVIVDNNWYKIIKEIFLLPEIPSKLDVILWSSVMETEGSITTNIVTIFDEYGNIVSWDIYNIDLNINWDGILFKSNNEKELNLSTFEWYKTFDLISSDYKEINTIDISIKNSFWDELLNTSKDIKTIDKIHLVIKSLQSEISVWWAKYAYEISYRDETWSIINDFNSRVYLNIPKIYWSPTSWYFDIKNWIWTVEFISTNVAWENIQIEFQAEWLKHIIRKDITILPEKAVQLELYVSNPQLEATSSNYTTVRVELKDRYWNLVFNDNSTSTQLELLNEYSDVIDLKTTSSNFSSWVSTFKINATDIPWIGYFKIWTSPSLSNNSFDISDNSWKITINWVWEIAWKLETYYFWNKDKIIWKKYNSIYTTLLWSNYWDITQKDYLAWSMLFEKNNRSLWVTALLNNPKSTNDIINISKWWNIKNIYSESDLSQDIKTDVSFKNNNVILNVYNNSLNVFIWNVYYNFDNNTDIKLCESDLNKCIKETSDTTIFVKPAPSYFTELENDTITISNDLDWKILDIDNLGNINRYKNISLEVDNTNSNNYLLLKILKDWEIIWNIAYNLINSLISTSRDEALYNTKIDNVWNSILLLLKSSSYLTKDSLENKIIYYNDPFGSNSSLDSFSKSNFSWYENFAEKWWLWWKDQNKTLLSFSSWKSIWESVKDYMSFSLINLWDPVISIRQIEEKLPKTNTWRNFDSTIWKLISSNADIESYEVFDYNNDWKDDILFIKNDGKFTLLENKDIGSDFINKWDLANIVDIWEKDLVKTWDFTWDNYDDIFFINNKWKPFLLNNNKKDFLRIPLEKQFNLKGSIIKSEKFDMNDDQKDDIVILDDSWAINIFYGWWVFNKPEFIKNQIADDYWVKIGTWTRNDNGLVYFDWLYQLWKVWDFGTEFSWNDTIPYELTDNLIFENLSYNVNQDKLLPEEYSVEYLENIDDFSAFGTDSEINNITTFIKSDYSENLWLKVEKIFIDNNGWFIQKWDIISVTINLKNTTNSTFTKIAYWEKIDDVLTLDGNSIKINKKNINLSLDTPGIDFLIDNFSLESWETLTINYELKTKPFDFWNIIVWLYEKDEVWDDKYWDIIIKEDNQNCSEPVEIYRSSSDSTYLKWVKEPVCNAGNIVLPNMLENNNIDTDWNWIPDYIDELSNISNIWSIQNYANNNLSLVNDSSSYNENKPVFEKIDDALDDAQNIIDWLGCWFGWWCIATPLNWAPLAPGWDPTLFWKPIWDWLKVGEWIPVFSSLTWLQASCWSSPCCLPSVWPISMQSYSPWALCWPPWAWWSLWVNSASNYFRLFVTPTLTWAMWTAICFGWPANVVWNAIPKWISPIVPGWNCIVIATPLSICSDDGSDWDIASTWFGLNWEGYNLINWNCKVDKVEPSLFLDNKLFSDYYNYKDTWVATANLESDLNGYYKSAKQLNKSKSSNQPNQPSQPFFSLNWWSGDEINVWIDFASIENWNFEDVIKIRKTRIWTFPNFLMDWVTRQIEEIANKLTDFPTLFIILPDFSWIFDWEWSKVSWNKNEKTNEDNINISDNIVKYLPDWSEDKIKKAESWIKEAYNFLSTVPLVKIEKETVNLNIPWVDRESINRTIKSRRATVSQRKIELIRAKDVWTFWNLCDYPDPIQKSKCEDENNIKNNLVLNFEWTIRSLERNIEIIEDYKKTPEKIYKWLNAKERYLEQILCNIDMLSDIMWWRISDNWKRFKAWVETYILVKAMLKSWQMLIDIFTEYDEECHECKNERSDLQTSIWSLISMVIPSIPVIIFPKWPDIIIDLHNIRAWLTINLPEFSITSRPILLPYLPDLNLPDTPTLNINFPELPLLPTIEIPELPDLPSLPSIELPNLPPPPTLPKILSSIEWVLDILKLVAKMMCLLKSSPFVPEWRAWDHIAFITERQWFMSFDFLSATLPQFSFPFVDAIKVTTFVNLEFETDFIVELARQAAEPINSFANNLIPLLDININEVDLLIPSDIDIDIESDWEIEWDIWMNDNKFVNLFALTIVKNIKKLIGYVENIKNDLVDNKEFKKLVNSSLASERITWNPKMDEIRKLWDRVNDMTYSKENNIINKLKNSNKQKFDLLKDILNTEIIKNKKTQEKFENLNSNKIIKVWYVDKKIDLEFYNNKFTSFNNSFVESLNNLIDNPVNEYKNDLKNESDTLLNKLKWWLLSYNNVKNKNSNSLLTAVSWTTSNLSMNSCEKQSKSEYKYTYEWMYIVENNISYRLFDYIDNLNWNEETTIIDYDNDSDDDLIFMVDNEIFIKENLENEPVKTYVSTPPIVLESDDNKFYNKEVFYEAINDFKSAWVDNQAINISFSSLKWIENQNYRIEFYEIIDKDLNIMSTDYTPKRVKKSIIDSFAWIDDIIIDSEINSYFETRNNIWYINSVWNLKEIQLTVAELINIKNDLINNNIVNLSIWTILYAWDSSFRLFITEEWSEEEIQLIVWAHTNIELKKWIEVIWITWDAYLKWNKDIVLAWTEIKNYQWLPLFAWSKIKVLNNETLILWEYPYININYYDWSSLSLDFEQIKDYEIYDLWVISDNYVLRTSRFNDNYYAKIKPFYQNIEWTYSAQILFSPQKESDNNPPELFFDSKIKIPIYQKKKIDLTEYIYENWGVKNINEVYVDFDLSVDSDLDWDPKNDKDTSQINIIKNSSKLEIEFWKYDELISKNIWIVLIDKNWNKWYSEVNFEVYSPIPDIITYSGWIIKWKLNENLDNEPVSFYRYRSWVIQKLGDVNWTGSVLSKSWAYDFEVNENWEWLKLMSNDNLIGLINEKTWIIEIKDFVSKIDVTPSNKINNDVVYPKINIIKNWENIFYEFLKIDNEQNINVIENFDNIESDWIYLKFLDKTFYNYFQNPEWVIYSPWVLSIFRNTDINKDSLFTIFPDGRINTINDFYSLKYFDYNWYVWFKLYDKHFNRDVAQVLLVINWEYLVK